MTTLQGTEKQVIWAESIKQEILDGLTDLETTASQRVENSSMPQAWVDVTKAGVEKAKGMIESVKFASKMIDLRKKGIVARVESLTIKDYQAAK